VPNLEVPIEKIIYLRSTDAKLRNCLDQCKSEGQVLSWYESDNSIYARLCTRYAELFSDRSDMIRIDNTGRTLESVVNELLPQL
jgi:hypothetical protein